MALLDRPTFETPEGYEQIIAAHEAEMHWAELAQRDGTRRTKIVADIPPCEL